MMEENWDDPKSLGSTQQSISMYCEEGKERMSFSEMVEENWDDPGSLGLTQQPISVYCKEGKGRMSFRKERQDNVFYGTKKGNTFNKKYENRNRNEGFEQKNQPHESKNKETLCMKVDSCKIGKIIGKHGQKIRELEEKSGSKIKIGNPCKEEIYLTNVFISGNYESQKKCEDLINELICEKLNILNFSPINSKPQREVPLIDWDSVNEQAEIAEKEKWAKCPPLKKNFYIEDINVANMTEEEVKNFRQMNNNIVVQNVFGDDTKILNPVRSFSEAFCQYPEIMKELEKQGFEKPSPIQCQSWPILLSGKDLIGIAQTGTGKTLAFLLPALIHIDGQEISRSERGGANVLIIAPTRELALQIEKEVQKYSYKGIKCVCVYGGGNRKEQINVVTNGVEIIIATPGRLNDLVEANVIDVTSVTYLVLDEADRMLDMGFEPQIRKILLDIRPDRQSVMTSATWPCNVQRLAERYMCNPVQVYIGSLDLAAVHSVTQTVVIVDQEEKKDYLLNFIRSLSDDDKVIVFIGRKTDVDNLSCDLSLNYILCQSIHGDREQYDREQALDDLKSGAVKILLATDVASRGLDIIDITKVFNYDFPKNIEEYVHRVGRTGRAGKSGEAITLFTRADWAYAGELITIMEEANQTVPEELYDMKKRFLNMIEKKNEKNSRNFNGNYERSRKRFENRRNGHNLSFN